MADVALYFDDSGFGGTAGSEDGWAAVANWQAGLGDGDYPTLSHLIENGWEDDLPGLEADIQSALKDDSSALGAGKASLEEFLSVLQDRAESDIAVAITLNEESTHPTVNEPSFMEINRKIGDLLFERFGKNGNDNGLKSVGPSGGPYVMDVYDEYVVYEQGGTTYRIGYKINNDTNEVKLNGDPQEVTRVVSYEPVTHEEVAANARKMPSAGADVTPEKACLLLKHGGVHDASGKWRPLTQAQRGMFGALCGQAKKGKKPTTHEEADLLRNAVSEVGNEQEIEEPTEIVDGTPLDESLTAEDIVAMYDASSQAPNQTNEEHVLALASVADRINGAARHPETGQFTSPEPVKESKSPKSPHLGEHSSTAYEATKRVKPGKGPASDSISYSIAAYGYAVAGDHVSAAKAHRKAATAHNRAYSNLREDNTERTLHKAAENLHRAAARAHALLSGGPAANGEFTDTWADESDPLYGLTPEEVRDSLAELCGRQVTESVRESAILF
jgi:hypothetical protein